MEILDIWSALAGFSVGMSVATIANIVVLRFRA